MDDLGKDCVGMREFLVPVTLNTIPGFLGDFACFKIGTIITKNVWWTLVVHTLPDILCLV